ncbi:hypothetical protein I4U23_023757 [Adineta vaga]|nr:hypothetical protein I4U23_023757 [Adineta vaga]
MASSTMPGDDNQNRPPKKAIDNKEDIRLIWLDEKMDNSSDFLLRRMSVLELNPAAQFYSDFEQCFNFIKSLKNEQVFLIFSGDFTQHISILTQIYNHRSLVAIFILSTDHQDQEASIKQYNKVVGIFANQDNLLKSIQEKMNLIEKQTFVFSLFDQEQKTFKDLSKESKSLVRHPILISLLQQIPQDEEGKQTMIDMCRDYFKNNKSELEKIEEFKQNYSHDNAIEWYTNECFLYKLLNKALRTEDIELLYTFRFFVTDLCTAIENESQQLKDTGIISVYRGAQIPNEQLEKLKDNVGKIISTNEFLSTTRNIETAVKSACANTISKDYSSILFEIYVDSSIKPVSFKSIPNKNPIKCDNEVLFNLNILFKIHSINFDSTLNLWKVQLYATDEGLAKIDEYHSDFKNGTEHSSLIIDVGRLFLNDSDLLDQVEKYFNMLLQSLPCDHPDIIKIYTNIANIHNDRDEFDLALKSYETAYQLCENHSSSNSSDAIDSLWGIALIHSRKSNFDSALDYYQKALDIAEREYPGDNLQKAKLIDNIGRIYGNKNEFDTALNYLFRALEMYKRISSKQQHDEGLCLGQIGYIYEKKGDLKTSLDYYYQHLNIEEQCLSFDHPDLIQALHVIIDTLFKIGDIKKCLQLCEEKLHIQKNKWGDHHPNTIRTLMILGDILKNNDPSKALDYFEKAHILIVTYTPYDFETYSKCLVSIASLYAYFRMFDKALECEFKVRDIYQQILPSDHSDLATSLRNIGICYAKMNKITDTLQYFNESLSIFKAKFGEEHGEVKRLKSDIQKMEQLQAMQRALVRPNKKSFKGKSYRS